MLKASQIRYILKIIGLMNWSGILDSITFAFNGENIVATTVSLQLISKIKFNYW